MTKASRADEATLPLNRDDILETPGIAFVLRVTDGPDRGAAFSLDARQPPILVGQGAACVVRLADRQVSRRHVSIEVVSGRVRVTDLGSSNGTFVDRVGI